MSGSYALQAAHFEQVQGSGRQRNFLSIFHEPARQRNGEKISHWDTQEPLPTRRQMWTWMGGQRSVSSSAQGHSQRCGCPIEHQTLYRITQSSVCEQPHRVQTWFSRGAWHCPVMRKPPCRIIQPEYPLKVHKNENREQMHSSHLRFTSSVDQPNLA